MLTAPFGNTESTETEGILSMAKMLLTYTHLITLQLAYQFAQACATEVHLIETICVESLHVNEQWGIYNLGRTPYYALMNDSPGELNTSRFPQLAYCAIMEK